MKVWNLFHFVELIASKFRQSLVLNQFYQRFFVFYVLWRHHSSATGKKFQLVELFSRANEVKTCDLEQQLILRMLRDLILHYSDSHLVNREQPRWSPVKSSCLFVLVFRIQPSYCFAESVQKELERLET